MYGFLYEGRVGQQFRMPSQPLQVQPTTVRVSTQPIQVAPRAGPGAQVPITPPDFIEIYMVGLSPPEQGVRFLRPSFNAFGIVQRGLLESTMQQVEAGQFGVMPTEQPPNCRTSTRLIIDQLFPDQQAQRIYDRCALSDTPYRVAIAIGIAPRPQPGVSTVRPAFGGDYVFARVTLFSRKNQVLAEGITTRRQWSEAFSYVNGLSADFLPMPFCFEDLPPGTVAPPAVPGSLPPATPRPALCPYPIVLRSIDQLCEVQRLLGFRTEPCPVRRPPVDFVPAPVTAPAIVPEEAAQFWNIELGFSPDCDTKTYLAARGSSTNDRVQAARSYMRSLSEARPGLGIPCIFLNGKRLVPALRLGARPYPGEAPRYYEETLPLQMAEYTPAGFREMIRILGMPPAPFPQPPPTR